MIDGAVFNSSSTLYPRGLFMTCETLLSGSLLSPKTIASVGQLWTQAGATSPAALAGTLVQTVAETLAGLALVNLTVPGHPMIFSNWPWCATPPAPRSRARCV